MFRNVLLGGGGVVVRGSRRRGRRVVRDPDRVQEELLRERVRRFAAYHRGPRTLTGLPGRDELVRGVIVCRRGWCLDVERRRWRLGPIAVPFFYFGFHYAPREAGLGRCRERCVAHL